MVGRRQVNARSAWRRRVIVAASFLCVCAGWFLLPALAQSADDHFLHSNGNVCTTGPDASASTFTIDTTAPTASQAKCRDSAGVNRTTFQTIGTWSAAPASQAQPITALTALDTWIGLKNSDDIGTYFDLRAELYKNGALIASGVTATIQGVTRNPDLAKEVSVTFGTPADSQLAAGDVVSLKILTKVAASGGHSNAIGLRLYYDGTTRSSKFGLTLANVGGGTNPLAQARSGHTATLLTDGTVLIAGGRNAAGVLSSAELYTAALHSSALLSNSLTSPRADHTATLLPQTESLLIAGEDAAGPLMTAELFNPATGAFQSIAPTVQLLRYGHTATQLLDGRILILGGTDASSLPLSSGESFNGQPAPASGALYDPTTSSFTLLPNALQVPRSDHTATLLPDGRVLVAGGRNSTGELSSAELFDPQTGQSQLLAATLTTSRAGHTATLRPDGTVAIIGGIGGGIFLNSGEVYTPATGQFVSGSTILQTPRANHTATLLPTGEILVTGGEGNNGILATTELIPPQADTIPPQIAVLNPANGAIDVPINSLIAVRFSEPINVTTLTGSTVQVSGPGEAIAGTVSGGESGLLAFFVPQAVLAPGTTYTLTLNGLTDLAGNPLGVMTSTFTTMFQPVITDVTPSSGPIGTAVTITGDHFAPAVADNQVQFNGVNAQITAATSTSLTVIVPIDATMGSITVTTLGGTATSPQPFTVTNPVPVLVNLAPSSVVAGSGDVTMTLTGSSFVSGATAFFGAQPLATAFVDAAHLTALVPAALIAHAGSVSVTAVNPAPGGGASNGLTFNMIGPVIQTITPTTGPIGTAVTITGQNFDPAPSNNKLFFNGTAAIVTSATSTQLTTTVPQGAATGPITLTTPTGSAASSPFTVVLSQDFTVTPSPVSVSVVAGGYRYGSVGATGLNGFTGTVGLSTDPLSSGVSLLFLPAQVTSGALSSVVVSADATAVPGTYPVTLHGAAVIDGQTVAHTAVLTIQIQAGGTTSLTGRVMATDDTPIPGVFVTLGNANATTDGGGNFFLDTVPTGHQMIAVVGSTANTPGIFYPAVDVAVDITAGAANVMPYIVYLPKIDIAHPITLPVDASGTTTQAFKATTPVIPNLEVNIPAGTKITDINGNPVSQITITAVPPDRSPMPLPAGVDAAQLFTIQPGGATLSKPVPITFPNFLNGLPGARANFYFFDVTTGAWNLYGQGAVSSDGRQVVPDAGVGIPRFAWHATALQLLPDHTPFEQSTLAGDPVDLATGFLTIEKTDLVIPGRLPIVFTRYYNSHRDTGTLPFGLGTGHSYDIQLQFTAGNNSLILIQGNDTRIRFSRVGVSSTFVSDSSPRMRGAVVTVNANNTRTLRQKDGTVLTFGTTGRLIQQTDRNGNSLVVTRDGSGTILAVGEPSGRQLTFSYSGSHLSAVTDPLGRSVAYHYDASGRLDSVTDPAGGVTHYAYDASYHITTITDARNIPYLQNVYDGNGRVTQQTTADGGVSQYLYFGPNGQAVPTGPTHTIIGGGLPVSNCGGGPPVVIQIGMPVSNTFACVLVLVQPGPANFLVTQAVVIDPLGRPTSYRFNSNGFLIEQMNVLGQKTKLTREIGTNRLLSTTDPLGRTTSYTYDANENVMSITDPQGNVTQFTYEPTFNRVASITDALTHSTTFTYDTHGNLLMATDPLTHQTTLTYNTFGQPLTVTDPLTHITTFEYDGVGNLTATVDPLGNRTTRAYDTVSRLTSLTDPRGFTTLYNYDSLNRVTSITDAQNGITGFGYDPNGNLLTVTDAKNQSTIYTYDNMDRLATRTDPLNRQESYAYDLNGNLSTFTDRKNQISSFAYDVLNRRTSSTYADSATTAMSYDQAGRLAAAEDSASGRIEFGYDDLDRLTQELTPQGTVAFAYDVLGRRTSMTANGQSPTSYIYDDASRLTQVGQGTQTVGLGYDASGRRISLTYPNGVTTSYSYDDASRLANITHQGPSALIESLTYSYDAAGNRISTTRANGTATDLPAAVQAAYDAANEQIQFNESSPNLTYDANGNLTSQTDVNGTTTYTWDARNRLVAMSGPSATASFEYDALGRRISKTINGATTEFQYDGNDIVAEIGGDAVGATYLRSLNIDEPFIRQGSGNEYYHTDALGSVLALSDQTGTVQTTYQYEAFGKTTVTGTSANPFQYTGRENDGTGVYYYRARYYSSGLQRFMSEDPLGVNGGDQDFYVYVENSPLKFIDPLGLYWEYSQSSGNLFYVNNTTNGKVFEGNGYSGSMYGLNDPNLQFLKDIGPIPQGIYDIGKIYKHEHLGWTMNLEPWPNTFTYGRDLFRIHAGVSNFDVTSSSGCIVLPLDIRRRINQSDDHELRVIP